MSGLLDNERFCRALENNHPDALVMWDRDVAPFLDGRIPVCVTYEDARPLPHGGVCEVLFDQNISCGFVSDGIYRSHFVRFYLYPEPRWYFVGEKAWNAFQSTEESNWCREPQRSMHLSPR